MEAVGTDVGSFVGSFVGKFVGFFTGDDVVNEIVGVGVEPSLESQGVLGKQARPSGHSDDDPVGQGLIQFVDAS